MRWLSVACIAEEIQICQLTSKQTLRTVCKDPLPNYFIQELKFGGVKIPEEDLISTTVSGEPKADVLVRLEETFNKDGAARMIFVEDKLSTLIKVANDKRLTKWDLFFVDWGYNTEDERQVAKHDYRMKLIGKEEFCALLREG